ncbi:hypothetical protein BGX38DRAFT_1206388 [Terfezia claveryi]|nr:hypothetical protein BGX38DRAFT_1206388 [Terfezia claveryi]
MLISTALCASVLSFSTLLASTICSTPTATVFWIETSSWSMRSPSRADLLSQSFVTDLFHSDIEVLLSSEAVSSRASLGNW